MIIKEKLKNTKSCKVSDDYSQLCAFCDEGDYLLLKLWVTAIRIECLDVGIGD